MDFIIEKKPEEIWVALVQMIELMDAEANVKNNKPYCHLM
jgi:hypothetical protein